MPSDRRSRMSMNNEARNLRLSILLFFQPSARLASARQFGPHTRIGYRSSIYVYVRTVSHARRYIRTYTYVWAFVWVARTFRKQSSRLARESSSALGDETDASIPETARYTTKKRQRNLLLCLRISMCIRVYAMMVRITYIRPTYTRHEYLRRYAFSPRESASYVAFSTAMDVVWFFSFFPTHWICPFACVQPLIENMYFQQEKVKTRRSKSKSCHFLSIRSCRWHW